MTEPILTREMLQTMAVEFKEACRAIDERAHAANGDNLKGAWNALIAGDTAGRDRLCDRADKVNIAQAAAKQEAWLRIGERHGIDREFALDLWRRHCQF